MRFLKPRVKYAKIPHSKRILVIYLSTVHGLSLAETERASGVNYNTIRNILRVFNQSGRTNKKAYVPLKKAPLSKGDQGMHYSSSKPGFSGSFHSALKPKREESLFERSMCTEPRGIISIDLTTSPSSSGQASLRFSENDKLTKPSSKYSNGDESTSSKPSDFRLMALTVPGGEGDLLATHEKLVLASSSESRQAGDLHQEQICADICEFEKHKGLQNKFFTGSLEALNKLFIQRQNGLKNLGRGKRHLLTEAMLPSSQRK